MTNEEQTLIHSINRFKSEIIAELTHNILPFWSTAMLDHSHGGFLGRIDGHGNAHHDANKGCVLNARILWTFSSAYRILQNPAYLTMATRAKEYLLNCFFDKKHGGVFWLIDHQGNMVDGKKQIYAQAFTIYALAEYNRATNDAESLEKAIELYRLIEQYSFDKKLEGYFEAFNQEWGIIGDLRLSEKDANEKKTMNTHLHVLEAYTNLYRIWKDDGLKQQLRKLILVFIEKIVNTETYHLNMFFDENWNDKTDLISYGHDIEASWLLYEAASVLNESAITNNVKELCLKITHVSKEGLRSDGSMIYEKFFADGHYDTDRHWWVQAETVVGCINAFELSNDINYLKQGMATWQFISQYIVDKKNGEWFWSVNDQLLPNYEDDKAGFWKCPYHNSRMCLEIIERKII